MATKTKPTHRFAETDLAKCEGYIALSTSAKARHIPFTLTYKRYCQLLKAKRCFYTGVVLDKSNSLSSVHFTLDRIDGTGPYSDDNVVPCAAKLNLRKGNLSVAEIAILYKGLQKKGLV